MLNKFGDFFDGSLMIIKPASSVCKYIFFDAGAINEEKKMCRDCSEEVIVCEVVLNNYLTLFFSSRPPGTNSPSIQRTKFLACVR